MTGVQYDSNMFNESPASGSPAALVHKEPTESREDAHRAAQRAAETPQRYCLRLPAPQETGVREPSPGPTLDAGQAVPGLPGAEVDSRPSAAQEASSAGLLSSPPANRDQATPRGMRSRSGASVCLSHQEGRRGRVEKDLEQQP